MKGCLLLSVLLDDGPLFGAAASPPHLTITICVLDLSYFL